MVESLHDMAQLTLTVDADVDRALDLRRQLAEIGADELGAVPTITDLVVAATARALRRHPMVNSRVVGDRIEVLADVHVGVAVAAERGLVVPVVRHADTLALADLAVATRALADAARAGRLALADLEGGTCSVTNLGTHGVDTFTPVVNPPNVAIVGVGRVRDDTAWDGDRPHRVSRMALSVTWDHRVLDGAPAAAFARTIADLLGQPLRLLDERP
jgi:pyruvate dehydrogenase E2 component (dihydrolipoamide acetyltransferase)